MKIKEISTVDHIPNSNTKVFYDLLDNKSIYLIRKRHKTFNTLFLIIERIRELRVSVLK